MVEMFKRCNFMLYSANKNSFEEGLRFTENNIVSYLSELEEYICALILFTANKLNLPNHATAFLSLDKLELRTHERREGPVSLYLLTVDRSWLHKWTRRRKRLRELWIKRTTRRKWSSS